MEIIQDNDRPFSYPATSDTEQGKGETQRQPQYKPRLPTHLDDSDGAKELNVNRCSHRSRKRADVLHK
jgi:hypothetical protein